MVETEKVYIPGRGSSEEEREKRKVEEREGETEREKRSKTEAEKAAPLGQRTLNPPPLPVLPGDGVFVGLLHPLSHLVPTSAPSFPAYTPPMGPINHIYALCPQVLWV